MQNTDLKGLLEEWPFKPDQVNARWIQGGEGKLRIQLRLDLGILQMETDGRPDGTKPHGAASMVDYYHELEKQTLYDIPAIRLGPAECSELQQEAVQYYYRYISFAALNFHEGVVRDTQHNLDLFDVIEKYAEDDRLAWQFLQFFPYVSMMNARAKAEICLQEGEYDRAHEVIRSALVDIRHYAEVYELDDEDPEDIYEIEVLLELMARIEEVRPKKKADVIKQQMDRAISKEDYEAAARLRDELKSMQNNAG